MLDTASDGAVVRGHSPAEFLGWLRYGGDDVDFDQEVAQE
jgi:hypothetical protein